MTTPVELARSLLFVPASRPERFARALESAASCMILDLEDAVAPDQKDSAREQMVQRLEGFTAEALARTLVRINAAGTPWHAQDLQAQLVPLIESLAGLDAADLLARGRQVARLAFGHLDFQLDLGMQCGADEQELNTVRFALVAASRRAQLPGPIDGVTVDVKDGERLQTDTRRARAFGFAGKLCIHPAQVDGVNAVFMPSAAEVAWARRVLDAARTHGGQAVSLDGKMVDLPVIRLAAQTLKQAQAADA